VFIKENQWYSVRMADFRINYLKYIATYRTYPISQITHIAEIAPSPKDPNKKLIKFKSVAQELINPIKLGSDPQAMQSPRYAQYSKFEYAKNLDDLFSSVSPEL